MLVKSVSIENMVNQRAAVMERVEQAMRLINEARDIATVAHIGFPDFCFDQYHYRSRSSTIHIHDQAKTREALSAIIDASAWKYLMAESGLRTFMDSEARAKWDEQVNDGKVPELTAANVEATFSSLYNARGDMFDRGVIECFRKLSWHYKTNLPQKFGKRLVMTYLHSNGYCSYNGKGNHLDDLMRVMSILDGKPEPDHRNGTDTLIRAALMEQKGYPKIAENDYMTIKLFKNGNGHITFRRLELVDKLNAIIAKHYANALPAEIR